MHNNMPFACIQKTTNIFYFKHFSMSSIFCYTYLTEEVNLYICMYVRVQTICVSCHACMHVILYSIKLCGRGMLPKKFLQKNIGANVQNIGTLAALRSKSARIKIFGLIYWLWTAKTTKVLCYMIRNYLLIVGSHDILARSDYWWGDVTATVPGHVQDNSEQCRDLLDGDEECVQLYIKDTQEVWPEGLHCGPSCQ